MNGKKDKRLCYYYHEGACFKKGECKGSANCDWYHGRPKEKSLEEIIKALSKFLGEVVDKPGINLPLNKLSQKLREKGLFDIEYHLSPFVADEACKRVKAENYDLTLVQNNNVYIIQGTKKKSVFPCPVMSV